MKSYLDDSAINLEYDKIEQTNADLLKAVYNKREKQIRDSLAQHGYVFDTYEDFISFGKQCHVVKCDRVSTLFVIEPNKPAKSICTFTEFVFINNYFDDDNRFTIKYDFLSHHATVI